MSDQPDLDALRDRVSELAAAAAELHEAVMDLGAAMDAQMHRTRGHEVPAAVHDGVVPTEQGRRALLGRAEYACALSDMWSPPGHG